MKTILVVDDETAVLKLFESLLESELGYQTITTNNALQVSDIIRDNDIDLAFFDMMMPEKNGIELLQEIKDNGYDFPIIIFTAHHSLKSAITALKEGAYDYIKKPIDTKEVVNLIEEVIGPPESPEEQVEEKEPVNSAEDVEQPEETTDEPPEQIVDKIVEQPAEKLEDDILVDFQLEEEPANEEHHVDEDIENVEPKELFSMGYNYFKRKKYRKAKIFWEKLLEYDPGNTIVKHNLNMVEKKLEQKGQDDIFDIDF